jgi:hypothetical protein
MKGGSLDLPASDITPPGASTGVRERKCLFKDTHNCGSGISADHFLSKAVLTQLTHDKLLFEGPGFSYEVAPRSDSLTVKRLCKRHNEAVSKLDAQAGRLFRSIHAIGRELAQPQEDWQRLHLFNGQDIERWLLKTMCMTYFAARSEINPRTHVLPPYLLDLFYGHPWRVPSGMYVTVRDPSEHTLRVQLDPSAGISLHALGNVVVGVSVNLSGFTFTLFLVGRGQEMPELVRHCVYRPGWLIFFRKERRIPIGFVWPEWSGGGTVWLSHGDPDATRPIGFEGGY